MLQAQHRPGGLNHNEQTHKNNNLHLSFKSLIGTTSISVNAFDALPEQNTFLCCAGSAVVLCRLDENLNITQQLFRARPDAIPIIATPSFYNPATPPNTPRRSRLVSPLKDGGGLIYNASSDYVPDPTSQGRANNRSREVSCVSLNHGGNLMAVGEVNWSAPSFHIFD